MLDVPSSSFLDGPSGPLVLWRRYRFPLPWDAQFPVSGLLHLEVGFGDGRYTVRRAADAPNERFVGLEISSASLQRGLANVRRRGLENVKLLKVGANFALQQLFAPCSLISITVNFPDPWPKERHEKNRLLQDAFFRLAASRLTPGGGVLLATDHPEYLDFALVESQKSGLFVLETAEPPEAVFETKYALKWKTMGKPLHYQVFRYNGNPTPDYPSLERDETMPHALLSGQLPPHVAFSKRVLPYAGGHVILHEVLRSLGSDDAEGQGEKWLLRATVEEAELRQQLLVSVRARGDRGEGDRGVIVGLEPFGDPVITQAARGAVHAVVEWLLTLPANLKVEARSY